MVATILKTQRAIEVSVFVVRAFIRMRRMLGGQRQFALKLAELEDRLATHDENFKIVFDALRKLMQRPNPEPEPERRKIGFQVREPLVAPYGATRSKARGKKWRRSK
jgi:hypothetical protein